MAGTSNAQRLILVTGATGKQGGAVVCHLLGRGFRVRALTRDPQKRRARTLVQSGVEVVQGDLDDRASIDRALRGVYGVFSVQDFWHTGFSREVSQGTMLADAAKDAGVEHLVYSSVSSADRGTRLPHFDSKWLVERHIRALGAPYTILRPVFFMENWGTYAREAILAGTLPQPLDPDRSLQQVSVDDVGVFAAMAFDRPEKWVGREMELAGEELTMLQTAEVFSRVLRREVRYVQVPWGDFREAAGEEMMLMYEWFNSRGYEADIEACRREHPQMKTLEQVIRGQDWRVSDSQVEAESRAAGLMPP